MARRDFAHIEASQANDSHAGSQIKLLFLTIVALAVVAGGFAIGFMVGQEMGMEKASSADKARMVAQLKKQQQELASLRQQAKQHQPGVSTTQVGELTFYNELPKQSVNPDPLHGESVPATSRPSTPVPSGDAPSDEVDADSSAALFKQIIEQELQKGSKSPVVTAKAVDRYYLQIASFQKLADAERFMPKLQQAGFQGVIKRVELADMGIWHRVYAGPFANRADSEAAKQSVKSRLNITGLIIKGD